MSDSRNISSPKLLEQIPKYFSVYITEYFVTSELPVYIWLAVEEAVGYMEVFQKFFKKT
jgi:hypothetical protein